jgi:hypothetical protein
MKFLRSTTVLAATAAAFALAACGGSDGEEPRRVAIGVTETGSGRIAVAMPKTLEAGVTELVLVNRTESAHSAQLIRTIGAHPEDEVLAIYEKTQRGAPLPEWFLPAGGVGGAEGGESAGVVQRLDSGTYWLLDDMGEKAPNYTRGGVDSFTAEGEPGEEELPEGEARIVAADYSFESSGLRAGRNLVEFDNAGRQPHHVIAARIVEGKTIEDVRRSIRENGPPPLELGSEQASTVLDGGTSQQLVLDLEPGTYALLCFIADREGGPPHAFKGMVAEAVVR